jgi:hypothetical protein
MLLILIMGTFMLTYCNNTFIDDILYGYTFPGKSYPTPKLLSQSHVLVGRYSFTFDGCNKYRY